MESKQKRKSITKSLWAITLAFMMLLSTFTGFMTVEVHAADDIPAPTIKDVFYGAKTISGGNLHRVRVNKKTERATVHVKLTDRDGGIKANVSVTPTSGSTWTVNLPERVEVAQGDKVTVYQEYNGKKSPEATADAKPSLSFKYKNTLKMPEGEIWIEDTSSNLLSDDEKAEAIQKLKDANTGIAGKFKSVVFTIDGTSHAYFEVTYTDNSKSGKIEATKLKIQKVTEKSQVPTIEKTYIADGHITITLDQEIAKGTKIGIVSQIADNEKNNFCDGGSCQSTKFAPTWVTVDTPTKTFTYKVSDEFLQLGQEFGVIVKEPHKFASCKKTEPQIKVPNVGVRDPKNLTEKEKDEIRQAIRKANKTQSGKSKLPDWTANNIPAYIEFDKVGNVKIINPANVEGDWIDDYTKFVPKRKPDGSLEMKSGKENSGIPVEKKELVTNLAPNKPTVSYKKETGEITVTPDSADTDAKTITVKYKDPEGTEKTETVSKGDDGKWKVVPPESGESKIKVDENTGVVTIKDSDIQNKTNVSATVTDEGGIAANDKTPQDSKNGSEEIKIYPKKPEITINEQDGSVTITPVDKDNDKVAKKMDITYTPVGKDETKTVTVERKDDGTWTVPEGSDFKVSDDGRSITITNDKIKSKTKITAQTNDGDADPNQVLKSDENEETVPDKTAPQPPTVKVDTKDGSAHITPPADSDTKTIEVKYPGADGNEKTFTATKTDTGWEISGDNGVTFDMSGYISIPYDQLKKADTITATAKDEDGNESKPGTDISLPPAPTAKENQGVITVTPPENTPAVNGMEITYTPDGSEETKTLKVVKGNDDKWKIDGDAIDGVTINENGTVTFASGTAKEKTKVTAISSIDKNKKSLEKGEVEVPESKAPEAPEVKVQEDGSVKITPKDKGETTVTVTYKDKDGNDKTATATKGKNGKWTIVGTNGEKIIEDSGVITIPSGNTNPGDRVKATATKGSKTSEEGKDLTKPAPPKVTPNQESGDVTITPPTKGNVDGMIIKYKKPDNSEGTIKVKKGEGGTWTFDRDNPDAEGVEVNGQSGVVTIKKGHAKEKTPVTADSTIETLKTPDKNQGEQPELVPDKTAPNPPTVAIDETSGNVTITPPKDEDTTKVTVTYKDHDGNDKTAIAKKEINGWKMEKADNDETVDSNGVITIPKGNYQTEQPVTAYGNDDAKNKSTDDAKTPVEVTFDVDGGKKSIDSSILVKGGNFVLPATYDVLDYPEGKLFVGWQVGNETKKSGDTITVNANTTVKALWKDIEYKVTFNGNTGTGSMTEATVKKGNKYKLPSNEFTAPENKKFKCWKIGEAEYQPDAEITVNEDTKVVAVWEDIQVTVSYDGNGGTGSMDGTTLKKGSTYKLLANAFTAPNNQKFKCWKIGETEYQPGAEITVNEDTQVVAVWENKSTENPPATQEFTVTFNANGGSKSMDSQTVKKGTKFTLPANGFTAPDKQEFAGWDVNGETKSVGDIIIINSDTEVKAVWKNISPEPQPEPEPPTPIPDPGQQTIAAPKVSVDTATGNLIITPPAGQDIKSVTVIYKDHDGVEKTITVQKISYKWSFTEEPTNGELANDITGIITIPKGRYLLGAEVRAYANNQSDQKSDEATKTPVEVSFDVNGASKDVESAITIKGENYVLPAIYDLPEYILTVPAGKEFDGWEVNGKILKAGDSIKVDNNTVVKALWRDKPVDNSGYHGYFYEPSTDIDYYRPNKDVKPVEEVKPKEEYKPAEEFETGRHFRYIYGYVDHTVRPEGMITRSEAAALIARLANLDMTDNSKPNFNDTPSAWYNTAINAVVKLNLMFADKDGNFRPNEAITRAEFARALFYIDKKNDAVAPFADVKGHEFEAAINQAYGNGLIVGYLDGTFKPDAFIQRAEAAKILNKYANRGVTLEGMSAVKMDLKHFIDIDQNHWAYCEIMEAANSHEYRRLKGTLEETWTMILPDDIMK